MNQRGVVIGLLLGVLLNTSELIAGQRTDEARLARVGVLVREAIDAGQLPGAVVLVGRGDEVVYFEAFGDRALVPAREQLTRNTIFDLASLTKVVATTTSVMQLVEAGQIRLTDRVGTFIPEFSRYGKEIGRASCRERV